MRILFLIDNLRPGGAQKALLALAVAARQAGFDPAVWCLGGSSEIEGRFQASGIAVLGKAASLGGAAGEPLALLRYLRRERVEIVQTFLFHSDVTGRVVGALARLGRDGRPRIVSSVRASNIRNRGWQFALLQWTAPLADVFTAVSRRTLDFAVAREGVVARRACIIPNGIDLLEWAALPDAATARAELGLRPDGYVVATVGRLHEQKGHDYLLAATAKLAAEFDCTVLIAGYGPLRQKLEERAQALGVAPHVRFLGYRTDVPRLLAACDLFVLPSLWEGMSNALLEAMAAGKPVVATAIDGNIEQVSPGVTGLLAPPKDSDALAEAMLELARDPARAREMGAQGREKVRREFSLEAMTRAYVDLYTKLVSQPLSRE